MIASISNCHNNAKSQTKENSVTTPQGSSPGWKSGGTTLFHKRSSRVPGWGGSRPYQGRGQRLPEVHVDTHEVSKGLEPELTHCHFLLYSFSQSRSQCQVHSSRVGSRFLQWRHSGVREWTCAERWSNPQHLCTCQLFIPCMLNIPCISILISSLPRVRSQITQHFHESGSCLSQQNLHEV